MHRPLRSTALLMLYLTTAACAPKEADTIQHVMTEVVDPSADALWKAVTSTVTAGGVTGHQPSTDAEWQALRSHALRVSEGARLLQSPRSVAHNPMDNGGAAGARTAEQIAADIKADPKRFYSFAKVLEQSAGEALAAINRKDVDALVRAGDTVDLACESCHAAYWHPRNPYVPFPDAEAFEKIAQRP